MATKKILVTHIFPHLDEICAFWLFENFGGKEFAGVSYRFISISEVRTKTYGGKPVDTDPSVVHIGVAGSRFDEHVRDGKARISSASLVRDFLKTKKSYPKDKLMRHAIDMLVDYVTGEDNGETHVLPKSSFRLQSVIYGAWMTDKNNTLSVVRFGIQMLDYLFTRLIQDAQFEIDWKKRIEFKTKWGRAVALATETSDTDGLIYSRGFGLAITLDPKEHYRMYRASPSSKVDLTKSHERLQQVDPKAHWYLHQSKKLIISGGSLAPKVKLSKLTLKQMIKAVR